MSIPGDEIAWLQKLNKKAECTLQAVYQCLSSPVGWCLTLNNELAICSVSLPAHTELQV